MKIPLRYQISEYDCGPTSMLNAISFLFEREQVPPEIIRNIMLYCLDCFGEQGHEGRRGTSCTAMQFLSHWLKGFGQAGRLPITSHYLSGQQVYLGQQSEVCDALRRGGVAVVRLFLDEWHYVLFTGLDGDEVLLFDPYYCHSLPGDEHEGACITWEAPLAYNRRVSAMRFDCEEDKLYALGPVAGREAVVLFNTDTMLTAQNTIEYFI